METESRNHLKPLRLELEVLALPPHEHSRRQHHHGQNPGQQDAGDGQLERAFLQRRRAPILAK